MDFNNILTFIENALINQGIIFDDEFNPEKSFNNLGLDSLDAVELAMSLETSMGIGIPNDIMALTNTPKELATLIETNYESYKT